MLHSLRHLSHRCAPYLLRKNIYSFHTTILRHNSKSEKQEEETFNDQQTKKKSYKRILKFTGATVLLLIGFGELMYFIYPEGSAHDMIMKLIKGKPYRNYVNAKRGRLIHLASEPTGVFLPFEMHFHLVIPEYFIRPGLNIHENSQFKMEGAVSVKDIAGRALFVQWQRNTEVLQANKQSIYTPMQELLKACAYNHVKFLKKRLNGLHIQRLEYISTTNQQSIDPLPEYFGNKCPETVIMISKLQDDPKDPDSGAWKGDIWFDMNPYIVHVSLNYPESQFAIKQGKAEMEKQINDFAKKITNREEVANQVKQVFSKATNDPKEVSKILRERLLEIQYRSFIKDLEVVSSDIKV